MRIEPSKITGKLQLPPSKSHTMRALIFASLARGISTINSYLHSPDTQAMIAALRLLGIEIEQTEKQLKIPGSDRQLKAASDVIQCGNSGQVLRFVGALSGHLPHYTVLTGDLSIRSRRIVRPLLEGLTQLGAFAVSALDNGYAPLIIKGPIKEGCASIDGADSQPVSALLMTAACAAHPIELHVRNAGEKPWVDLTLHWLHKMGITYQREDYHYYRVEGGKMEAFTYSVPGDLSSAAFPIGAALATGSPLRIEGWDANDVQGDKKIVPILEKMGASFEVAGNILTVLPHAKLHGCAIDINDCIDALPLLAVLACFAQGQTTIYNAAMARQKESDRIQAIVKELRKMGASIEERDDGVCIEGKTLHGASLEAHADHRLAMALVVAALGAKGPSVVQGADCVKKSYPNFIKDFQGIGACVR